MKEIKIKVPNVNKKKQSKDFNFFKEYLGDEKKDKNYTKVSIVVATIIFAMILITYTFNYMKIRNLEKQITQLKSFVDSTASKRKITTVETLEKKEEILNNYYDGVKEISGSVENRNIVTTKMLKEICSNTPKDISFKITSIGEDGVNIQGVSEKRQSVAEFQHNLKAIDIVEDVQVSDISENTEGNKKDYSFSLKCTLKDVDKNEDN